MKIVHIETLISRGSFPKSKEWEKIRQSALDAVQAVDWPLNSGTFTVNPSKKGNGVKPIKNKAIQSLKKSGWQIEYPWPVSERKKPGNMDAAFLITLPFCTLHFKLCLENLEISLASLIYLQKWDYGLNIIAFEWETGNISSSHRSMNKMCLGLLTQKIIGGLLIVPSRNLYPYLTDRIGNFPELEPYLPLWRSIYCDEGVLEIIVIEQDEESFDVPKIAKGTDGRAIK
ncbi:MAG: hypothetical protein QNJ55_33380 [Xenococcus sp. MO_188.B8]|nr:hypothetical protein [Xenococcus sp. MO_188.B8]